MSNDDHESLLGYRETSRFLGEDDIVGVEHESEFLKERLMDNEVHRTVISVWGMGGSGKTTLVGKVYKNDNIKRQFDCYAWITVSQTYKRDDLFRRLIKEFYRGRKEEDRVDLSALEASELVNMLRNYLQHKRYLVVLDDVWDMHLWAQIGLSLPENQLGSRIILTTREQEVASSLSGVPICHCLPMKGLGESEAWNLFRQKAFPSAPNKACPTELESLARELMGKCEGLPLAIVALGGLMSSKNSITEWSKVNNNLNWVLNNEQKLEFVKSILLLGFENLPCQLKRCFLYCSLFPEDHPIQVKRLMRLWSAEGFVQQDGRTTPLEVAETYLTKLISRGMLQVASEKETGRPKYCKMHDLLREIALSISEKEKFCAVYDGRVEIEESGARHISIQTTDGNLKSCRGMSKLRSFLAFRNISDSPSFPDTILSNFKWLRVLDLENVPVTKLPEAMGTYFNLRYLNLKGTQVAELPKSIVKLRNLEVLEIGSTGIDELPRGIAKLQKLRRLVMYRFIPGDVSCDFLFVSGIRVSFQISMLKKLQIAFIVAAEGEIIKQLGSMTQLTKVGISNVKASDRTDLCSSMSNWMTLHSLFLIAKDEMESLPIDELTSPPLELRTLRLMGKLEKLPNWICSLHCLTYLELYWSRLSEDLLASIAELPCLGRLSLTKAFVGEKLHFRRGFAKLKLLHLNNFPQLTEIIIEKGVMSDIEKLVLESCMGLNALPQGIEYLMHLKTLNLILVSEHLRRSIQGEESRDVSKVKHIRKINHYYETQIGDLYEDLF